MPPRPGEARPDSCPAHTQTPEQEAATARRSEDATAIIAAELADWAPSVRTTIWSGSPASQIIKAATEFGADLIVVASGSTGITETVLMGSTAHRVLNYAPCPVLVVRR